MAHIRRALESDARNIHEAHMRSIREVCSKQHSAEEISGWGNRPFNEERRLDAIKNHCVWVVENQNHIEGYGHLQIYERDNVILSYVHGLYLTPQVLNQGLGKKLFLEMLNEAKKAKAVRIQLEATLTAHEFYIKMGFYDYAPMKTVEIGGSKVSCYPMRLDLNQ
jgi:GNAT superfamily N-acetyltransferase